VLCARPPCPITRLGQRDDHRRPSPPESVAKIAKPVRKSHQSQRLPAPGAGADKRKQDCPEHRESNRCAPFLTPRARFLDVTLLTRPRRA